MRSVAGCPLATAFSTCSNFPSARAAACGLVSTSGWWRLMEQQNERDQSKRVGRPADDAENALPRTRANELMLIG